jgi:hypothetical protein
LRRLCQRDGRHLERHPEAGILVRPGGDPAANAATVLSDGIIIQDDLAQAIQSDGRTKTFALVGEEGYARQRRGWILGDR